MSTVEASNAEASTVEARDRKFIAFASLLAALVAAFILWLVYFRAPGERLDLAFIRPLNAFWNGAAGVFLLAGFIAVRSKRTVLHRYLMITALACSALFLVGYMSFTILDGTRISYMGDYRPLYLAILISHTILAALVPLFASVVVYFAVRRRFVWHKRVARVAFPVWMYVSVTGVVIYEMLKR